MGRLRANARLSKPAASILVSYMTLAAGLPSLAIEDRDHEGSNDSTAIVPRGVRHRIARRRQPQRQSLARQAKCGHSAKIDCAGVLSTPALWAAVVAFARGTAPLADAACNQSLKIYAESSLRGTTASSVAAAARPPHTSYNTHNQRAPRRRATAGFARDLDAAPAVAATRPSARTASTAWPFYQSSRTP